MKDIFLALAKNYAADPGLTADLWNEIEKNYSKSNRHYHTLGHLENLLSELNGIRDRISDWNTILFTLFYHDVIYNPLKSNNEEKSADLAGKRLRALTVPTPVIDKCKHQILATKQHLPDPDNDTDFFTDADLSILGQSWNVYEKYAADVRKEYSIYPDLIYNPGRKKVLQHFLEMNRIFKTEYFFNKYETAARHNLQKEIQQQGFTR